MRTIVLALMAWAAAAPAAAQDVTGPEPGALARLVAELEARNPELAAARREIDMRAARIAPAGAPPDPVVSAGYMSGFLRPPFFPSSATPDAWRRVGVTQEFPYPGTLDLRTRVAEAEADAARWMYEDVRVRLVEELKLAYIEYVLVDRVLAIVGRSRAALEEVRAIAEARFAVGQASQQDVLRAQLELSLLLERLVVLERDRATLAAEVNRLAYRPAGAPVPADDPAVAPATDWTADELRARVGERYPAIRAREVEIARGEQALALARREVRPDFAVSVMTEKRVGGMPWMYGVDIMVRVPLFASRKQRPMVTGAAASLEGTRHLRDSARSDAESRVTQTVAALDSSRRLMELYGDSVLPQARLTLESSMADYEVGRVDFMTLLANVITVLDYESRFEEEQARYRQALARLEPLTGLEFLR